MNETKPFKILQSIAAKRGVSLAAMLRGANVPVVSRHSRYLLPEVAERICTALQLDADDAAAIRGVTLHRPDLATRRKRFAISVRFVAHEIGCCHTSVANVEAGRMLGGQVAERYHAWLEAQERAGGEK